MEPIKEKNNVESAPPTPGFEKEELKNIYYNCTQCPSLIEIISIDENNNTIEFKCLNNKNNHNNDNIVISINEYLKKMEENKIENIELGEICYEHDINDKYYCYCLNCHRPLCRECLKSKVHKNHDKNLILEMQPTEEDIKLIENKLKEYDNKIEKLNKEKENKIKEFENKLNNNKIEENKKLERKIKENKIIEEKEIKLNKNRYINDLKEIKRKYENEVKLRKIAYENEKNNIKKKHKIINNKEYIINNYKIKELTNIYNKKMNNLCYDIKIKNISNLKKLNEIVYNTYNNNKYK